MRGAHGLRAGHGVVGVKTGLYGDMPNDDYHAQTDWLSSSMLKSALPEHYKTGGSQDALDFGTLFHAVVLEPHTLDRYVALDAEKIGLKSDGTPAAVPTMTVAWKRAVAEAEQDGRTVVAQSDWDRAHAMADKVREHATASRLLFDGEGTYEESAFAVDEHGRQVRARFDRRIPGAIVDLKSTSAQPGRKNLESTVLNYGYDLSAAHYLEVADLLDLDCPTFALVFASKTEPYRVTVTDLDKSFLARGRALRALALDRLTNPETPAYEGAHGYLTLRAPAWARIDETEQIA